MCSELLSYTGFKSHEIQLFLLLLYILIKIYTNLKRLFNIHKENICLFEYIIEHKMLTYILGFFAEPGRILKNCGILFNAVYNIYQND